MDSLVYFLSSCTTLETHHCLDEVHGFPLGFTVPCSFLPPNVSLYSIVEQVTFPSVTHISVFLQISLSSPFYFHKNQETQSKTILIHKTLVSWYWCDAIKEGTSKGLPQNDAVLGRWRPNTPEHKVWGQDPWLCLSHFLPQWDLGKITT